eukprot:TRINITY_DN22421_c0_g3_i1.p1 TRINITY_DN22421_c0_g3~~TRINITY_DN22421_c0_g3_i1.p1  ORF type:complete len:392 (-),score=56.04 TRINITY_DN22421_c0_g3_i1:354-1460(-)
MLVSFVVSVPMNCNHVSTTLGRVKTCGRIKAATMLALPAGHMRCFGEVAPCAGTSSRSILSSVAASAVGALVGASCLRSQGRRWRKRRDLRSMRMTAAASAPAATKEMSPVVLEVRDVVAESTDEARKVILQGLNITIRENEVHAVMGPNGSGKSTLGRVLIGDSSYEVMGGSAKFGNKDLFNLEPHERALAGMFLAFQSPPAVVGVSNLDFLRAAYNAQRRFNGEPEFDVIEFYGCVMQKLEQLKIDPDFLDRNVNEGFSGGERKRNEMLQLSVLEPRLAILDEIDSGLDIDALKDVADGIAMVRKVGNTRSVLMVTHSERFLRYVNPDFVHVMNSGRIIRSGGRELADRLDKDGYDWVIAEADTDR